MKLRKISILLFITLVAFSCKNDDDGNKVVIRDRAEVYAENLADIEEFLQTHYYNYDAFDFSNPYSLANDNFKIEFGLLADNPDKTPLIDMVDFKMVTDPVDETIEYKLYYLKVREGNGEVLHTTDEAFVAYNGLNLQEESFDSSLYGTRFILSQVNQSTFGVVEGFKESIIEFKTATSFTENGDGTVSYHNHGIGAAFIPSGLGYFSTYISSTLPDYSPLIFTFGLYDSVILDHDNDLVPSFIENLDGDNNLFNDDTDDDNLPNLIDTDDDNDGIQTKDEVEVKSYTQDESMQAFTTREAANDYFLNHAAANEMYVSIKYEAETNSYTLNTIVLTDDNANGVADYLEDNNL